jgi:methionyl-tRNA synthetase
MNYYVTTSIPYVNGEPHLGHAMEFLMADVLARAARARGDTVIYSTGTDEHGGKNAEKAKELNLAPKQYVDQQSAAFRDLQKLLNISNDRFIRTTDPGHEQRAQIIWKNLAKDIYKGTYVGLYCTGCEEYVSEKIAKANGGVCPDHNRPYEKLEEENYFFSLSRYTEQIRTAIENGSFRIIPQTRKNEIMSVLKGGLEDISVSRPKEKIDWGIPVPGDKDQIMYVWFEALMNYLTVLGYPEHDDFKKYWPADVQVIGKGIIRQHAGTWAGMLLGLGLPLTKMLYVHGYVTVDNQKMGKSLGNAIPPKEIIDMYGVDAFRYYFLRHIPSYNDGDFSWDKFEAAYNNELANELGNAVQRTAVMIQKYQNGIIGDIPPAEHDTGRYREALDNCRFDQALEEIWDQVRGLNQYIDEEKPWEIAKAGDDDHLREVLAAMVSDLLEIADLLVPFLPEAAANIQTVFSEGIIRPYEGTLFPKKELQSGSDV